MQARVNAGELLKAETHLAFPPSRDRGRCVILSPTTYHVGMSGLALHVLYDLLNRGDLPAERVFLPEDPPAGEPLRSLESATPLGGFDYILITSSFEPDWLQIPVMLEAGGVPPARADRGGSHPLVVAGGPAVTMNPEPLADLVDAFLVGEVEPVAEEFTAALAGAASREQALEGLGRLPGMYLPAQSHHAPELGAGRARVTRLCADRLDDHPTESVILTPHTEFADRFLVEVGRGCGRGCRFCLARRIYHPNRARRPAVLLERIDKALAYTSRVGLVGAAISDYPWTDELFSGLLDREAQIAVSSVRAESVTENLLEALARSGQDTLTVAPEAGTERLREAVGKAMTDARLLDCLDLAARAGLARIKLYFMVGLPGETAEDVRAIARLVETIRGHVPGLHLAVALNPFVPKPHTPFEREGMLPGAELNRRISAVTADLRRGGVRDVTAGSVRWAAVQAVLARGGRELGRAVVTAAGQGPAELKAAVRRAGRNWDAYLGPQEHAQGAAPWEVVEA